MAEKEHDQTADPSPPAAEAAAQDAADAPADEAKVAVQAAEFTDLDDADAAGGSAAAVAGLDLILDITMPVSVELGRASMTVQELLQLRTGSVVELERMAGEPVDLYVRDVRFARGEVVVVDNNFGLRLTEILNPQRRLQELGK